MGSSLFRQIIPIMLVCYLDARDPNATVGPQALDSEDIPYPTGVYV